MYGSRLARIGVLGLRCEIYGWKLQHASQTQGKRSFPTCCDKSLRSRSLAMKLRCTPRCFTESVKWTRQNEHSVPSPIQSLEAVALTRIGSQEWFQSPQDDCVMRCGRLRKARIRTWRRRMCARWALRTTAHTIRNTLRGHRQEKVVRGGCKYCRR